MSSPLPLPGALPGTGRSLPRPGSRRRANETKLTEVDFGWLTLFILIAIGNTVHATLAAHSSRALIGAACFVVATVGTYLSGLALRDRPTAVIATCLVSMSQILAAVAAVSTQTAVTLAALPLAWYLYQRGQLIAALVIAAVAGFARPEMLSLGIVVVAVGLWERKPQAATATALYVLILVAYAVAAVLRQVPPHLVGANAAHGFVTIIWAAGPAILWFLTAFVTDLWDKETRTNWLPSVIWVIIFLAIAAAVNGMGSLTFTAPGILALYLLSAAGIARVLPSLAGDLPSAGIRYAVAVAAILLLVAIRFPSDSRAAHQLLSVRAIASSKS